MDRLKDLLGEDQEKDETPGGGEKEIEVYAYSAHEALKTAALALNENIVNLQYQVLERGAGGMMGFGKKPDKYLIFIADREESMEPLAYETYKEEIKAEEIQRNRDGYFKVRITKAGYFPRGHPSAGERTQARVSGNYRLSPGARDSEVR